MIHQICISLPVRDIEKSRSFFANLGCSFNESFSDPSAALVILSEHINLMLMTHQKYQEFAPPGTAICDPAKHTQALFSLSCDSRQEVDQLFGKALESGATTFEDAEDHGVMYGRSFLDLDGHGWQLMYIDTAALP